MLPSAPWTRLRWSSCAPQIERVTTFSPRWCRVHTLVLPTSGLAHRTWLPFLYTSSTTGRPKDVLNGHNAYVTAGHEFATEAVRTRADDVVYTSLPLFHINAQSLTTMGSLVSGRPMVLAPRFSASGFFDNPGLDIRRSLTAYDH